MAAPVIVAPLPSLPSLLAHCNCCRTGEKPVTCQTGDLGSSEEVTKVSPHSGTVSCSAGGTTTTAAGATTTDPAVDASKSPTVPRSEGRDSSSHYAKSRVFSLLYCRVPGTYYGSECDNSGRGSCPMTGRDEKRELGRAVVSMKLMVPTPS